MKTNCVFNKTKGEKKMKRTNGITNGAIKITRCNEIVLLLQPRQDIQKKLFPGQNTVGGANDNGKSSVAVGDHGYNRADHRNGGKEAIVGGQGSRSGSVMSKEK